MSSHLPILIEDQLFTYQAMREVKGSLEFANVSLKVPMGDFPIGYHFAGAILTTGGIVSLMAKNGSSYYFYLLLKQVVEVPRELEEGPETLLEKEAEIDRMMDVLFSKQANANQ